MTAQPVELTARNWVVLGENLFRLEVPLTSNTLNRRLNLCYMK